MPSRGRTSLNRIAERRLISFTVGLCVVGGGLPLVVALILSFCSIDSNNSFSFGSLDGYRAVFAAGRIEELVKILVRAVTVTAVTMLISVPSAYWLGNMQRTSIRYIILTLLVTPWLVSDMLRAFGWQLLLSPVGPVSKAWSLLTGLGPLEGLRYNFSAVIIGLVSAMLPAGVLGVVAALPNRDRTEWLAATELGRPHHVFAIFAFGRARPGIVVGVCIVFVLSCFASAEPKYLDGPTQTSIQTVAASLVNDGVPALLAFGTLLWVFALCSCVVAAAAYGLHAHPRRSVRGPNQPIPPPFSGSLQAPSNQLLHGIFSRLLDVSARVVPPLAGIASITLCCAPMLTVAAEAFWQPSPSGGRWTLENFQQLLSSEHLIEAIGNSAVVAGVVAFFATAIAFILSLAVWNVSLQRWVLVLLAALVILPGDAYAISLVQLLKLFGNAQGGWVLVVIAHVLWAVPFATGTLMLANRHLSENVLQASLEYSNGPLAVILRVIGRINIGRIAGVALLAGTISLNEYIRSSYLGGRLLTIGNEVHGRLAAGLLPHNRGVFAAELLVFAISIEAVIVTFAIVQSRQSSGKVKS